MRRQWQKSEPYVFCMTFLPLAASFLLHSLLLTPLYLTLASDINWNSTLLPTAIDYLRLFLEYAFFWLLFAFLGRTMGKWNPLAIILPVVLSCILRQSLELVMGYAVMGFPSWREFCEEELTNTLLQLLLDALLIAAAALFVKIIKKQNFRTALLAALPVLFQIVFLTIAALSLGYNRRAYLFDLVVHIVCFFAGFGVIFAWNHLLRKEKRS